MILLFNTAYRRGYLLNVLRTIFLPQGALNEYRYSVGDELQVTSAKAAFFKEKIGQKVLICFGDRFATNGYEFHPLRVATLESVEESGSRVYFKVRLGKHASCKSPREFTTELYKLDAQDGQEMLRLTNNDPIEPKDGRYAIEFADTRVLSLIEQNDHSWSATVTGLSKAHAFQSTTDCKFVFAKCDLVVNGLPRQYVSEGEGSWFRAERDDDARLAISYIFPGQHVDRAATARLQVTTPPGIQLLASGEQSLDMPENKIEFPFAFESGADKRFFTFDVKFLPVASGVDLVGPNGALAIKVLESTWRKALGVTFALIYVAGAICSGTGKIAVGEALKGVGLVGIFLTLGSKKIV